MKGRKEALSSGSEHDTKPECLMLLSQTLIDHMANDDNPSYLIPSLRNISSAEFRNIRVGLERGMKLYVEVTHPDIHKRLKTSQCFVEATKIRNAVTADLNETACGTLRIRTNSKGKEVVDIILTDGNHRTALALLRNQSMFVRITKTWDERNGEPNPNNYEEVYGFNMIRNKIASMLGGKHTASYD